MTCDKVTFYVKNNFASSVCFSWLIRYNRQFFFLPAMDYVRVALHPDTTESMSFDK